MAFRLTTAEAKRRDGYATDLRDMQSKLEDAVRVYNEAAAALREPLQQLIDNYNETLGEARGFVEDIATAADEAIDAKSDRWRDGDKGQAAINWRDEWQAAELDDLEIEFPTDIELADLDHADNLDALSFEAQDD